MVFMLFELKDILAHVRHKNTFQTRGPDLPNNTSTSWEGNSDKSTLVQESSIPY